MEAVGHDKVLRTLEFTTGLADRLDLLSMLLAFEYLLLQRLIGCSLCLLILHLPLSSTSSINTPRSPEHQEESIQVLQAQQEDKVLLLGM
jgi:hypothetical protein